MKSLNKITLEQVKKFIPDKEAADNLKTNEPIFEVLNTNFTLKDDKLLNVEVALRKCKRVGFFRE